MRTSILVFWFCLLYAACASGGGAAFRQDVGNANRIDAYDLSVRIVDRFQYEVLREDTTANVLRIETHWQEREPFDDEAALGVTAAETRLVIDGRYRGVRDAGGVEGAAAPEGHFALRLAVDNRVRTADSSGWNESLSTQMFRDYAGRIAQDFQDDLSNIGVRRR
jgi:hypothetical protein